MDGLQEDETVRALLEVLSCLVLSVRSWIPVADHDDIKARGFVPAANGLQSDSSPLESGSLTSACARPHLCSGALERYGPYSPSRS